MLKTSTETLLRLVQACPIALFLSKLGTKAPLFSTRPALSMSFDLQPYENESFFWRKSVKASKVGAFKKGFKTIFSFKEKGTVG